MEEWHNGTCDQFQQWKLENGKADQEFQKFLKDNQQLGNSFLSYHLLSFQLF
jgi:hypothetical protein